MKSRKYPTTEEAYTYLNSVGKLEMFGRAGHDYEYMVCKLTLHNGKHYFVDVYNDGWVRLPDRQP